MLGQGLQTHQLVWGLPNPRATAVFGRAGYHCVGQFARYVRVLRSAKYLERHFPRWMSRAAGPLIDWARMGSMAIRGFGARGYVMKWQDQPDARFDDLWERSAKPGQLMGVRNEQYLTWRFVDCPFGTYTFLTLVSPGDRLLLGYAVCELEQQTMHVCDFLVDENAKGAAAHLWRELAREAFGAGCASLSTEFLGSERVQQELKDAGLIAREHFPLYAGVADRSPPLLEEGHWYITCADADG